MEIIIKGNEKEIAALVLAVQERRDEYVSRYFLEKYLELRQKRDDFLDSQFKKWEEQSDSNFYGKPS